MRTLLTNLRSRAVDVHADEVRAMWFGFVFNFIVLASYYVIRPIRDDIGAAGGVENLSWMFTATLIATLIANALFSAIVGRMSPTFHTDRVSLLHPESRVVLPADAFGVARSGRLGRSRVLRVGQRFQLVRRDGLLGFHD